MKKYRRAISAIAGVFMETIQWRNGMYCRWMLLLVSIVVVAGGGVSEAGWFSRPGASAGTCDTCGSGDSGHCSNCSNSNDCSRSFASAWYCSYDDECECDRECCESCGKKKPRKKKKCCLFTCLECAEPPRGEVGVSVAGRLQRNAFDESGRGDKSESATPEKKKDQSETAALEKDRIDQIEKDLTRLTLVVESVASSQLQQQADLTRATQVLEELARRIEPKQ